MADTVLTELKIHKFDTVGQMSQYESEIGDDDIVFTPDMSAKLFLFMCAWSDYVVGDMSWLRAGTFSWHSGDKYVAAYDHLLSDYNSSTLQTETIGDITITYYLAEDGHKICLLDQESNIVSLYNNTGSANYYMLDTANKQFKLPRKQKRTLVRAVKNDDYTWYNLYSDGWIEQGGFLPDTWSGSKTFTFPVEMMGYYTLTTSSGTPDIGGMHGKDYVTARTETGFTYSSSSISGNFTTKNFSWRAEGYASPSAYADTGVRLEYYFVGNFEQSAIEQTAGLNAEMFNDLNAHKVVDFQAPTAANGYTWYRKYADGWVEQGGKVDIAVPTTTITLPVEMADTNYTVLATSYSYSSSNFDPAIVNIRRDESLSTTSFKLMAKNHTAASYTVPAFWQVSGISGQ